MPLSVAVLCASFHSNSHKAFCKCNTDRIYQGFVTADIISSAQGNSLQFECSFEEYGDYQEQGNEYKSMCLDSVSVIPANTQEAETIYSAPSNNLSEVCNVSTKDGIMFFFYSR